MTSFPIHPKAFFSRLTRTTRHPLTGGLTAFVATLALALGWPHPAFAQTLGDMMCSVYENLGPLITLMDGIAYIAGGVLIGQGLIHLKNHADSPNNNPFHQSASRLVAGALLMALPYFANELVTTIFVQSGGGGATTCVPGGVVADGDGLDVLVTNFVGNIQTALTGLVSMISFVMGVFLLIRGLMKGAKYGTDPRSNSVPNIVTHLGIGTILIVVGQSLSSMLLTVFGSNNIMPSSVVMGWNIVTQLNATPQFVNTVVAALTFFQLIGMIAFVRGWFIIKNAVEGSGQATVAQGFTHIIGGVLAINIYSFLEIMDQTFGTNFLT